MLVKYNLLIKQDYIIVIKFTIYFNTKCDFFFKGVMTTLAIKKSHTY